jgi:hypothetical protein
MIRRDLRAAGLPHDRHDFHCLRHSFISRVGEAGATVKDHMSLARHSDANLTLNVYSHSRLEGLAAVVNRMPTLMAGECAQAIPYVNNGLPTSCPQPASHGDSSGPVNHGPGGTHGDPSGHADRFTRLVTLAEQTGLYLDLTGLGCYRKGDVPAWYDALDEPGRWAVQARFWEAVAARCAGSPAVFCYDLMNEPVVTGGSHKPGEWLAGEFGGFSYVQFITLEQKGRPRPEIARAWVETLARAIRRVDRRHLITVGMVDWSLDRPGLTSGFVPAAIAPAIDFLCVHLYPKAGKLDEAIATLEGFATAGKPVLIEETFPLACGVEEFRTFLARTKKVAAGWVGFYWGKTREELKGAKTIPDALTLGWLDIFRAGPP